MRRRRMSKRVNRRVFRRGLRVRGRNLRASVMRGGYRI